MNPMTRTILQVSTATLLGLSPWANAQTPSTTPLRQTQADDYTRYELLDPASASFRILYEVTATTPGAAHFWNAIRKGSVASDKVDIGEPVTPASEAAVVRFKPVAEGTTLRIRIRETYTDPARYRMDGDLLVWDRSFGRPQNAVILPDGYMLVGSSFPASVSVTEDGRIRP